VVGQDVGVPPAPDFATKPTLRGQRVTLRPLGVHDVDVMAQILSDPQVRLLTGSVESSEEAAQPHPVDDVLVSWYATRGAQVDRLDLGIEDASGELVGEIVLNDVDLDAMTCNLRVLIGPAGRDRGLGTEAVGLVTAYGIEVLGLQRITLEVFEFNPRGRRVYEKVGYVETGRREDALVVDGVGIAAIDMALSAASWSGFPTGPTGEAR
jgi:RimJ/RimL family protein N-acetyltransferase